MDPESSGKLAMLTKHIRWGLVTHTFDRAAFFIALYVFLTQLNYDLIINFGWKTFTSVQYLNVPIYYTIAMSWYGVRFFYAASRWAHALWQSTQGVTQTSGFWLYLTGTFDSHRNAILWCKHVVVLTLAFVMFGGSNFYGYQGVTLEIVILISILFVPLVTLRQQVVWMIQLYLEGKDDLSWKKWKAVFSSADRALLPAYSSHTWATAISWGLTYIFFLMAGVIMSDVAALNTTRYIVEDRWASNSFTAWALSTLLWTCVGELGSMVWWTWWHARTYSLWLFRTRFGWQFVTDLIQRLTVGAMTWKYVDSGFNPSTGVDPPMMLIAYVSIEAGASLIQLALTYFNLMFEDAEAKQVVQTFDTTVKKDTGVVGGFAEACKKLFCSSSKNLDQDQAIEPFYNTNDTNIYDQYEYTSGVPTPVI